MPSLCLICVFFCIVSCFGVNQIKRSNMPTTTGMVGHHKNFLSISNFVAGSKKTTMSWRTVNDTLLVSPTAKGGRHFLFSTTRSNTSSTNFMKPTKKNLSLSKTPTRPRDHQSMIRSSSTYWSRGTTSLQFQGGGGGNNSSSASNTSTSLLALSAMASIPLWVTLRRRKDEDDKYSTTTTNSLSAAAAVHGSTSTKDHSGYKTQCEMQMVLPSVNPVPGDVPNDGRSTMVSVADNISSADSIHNSNNARFQIMKQCEVKEEMKMVKLARFLRDIHELAVEQEEQNLRTRMTKELQEEQSGGSSVGKAKELSVTRDELESLSREKAEEIISSLHDGAKFGKESLISLAQAATDALRKEPTLVDLRGRGEMITVVGDIHGSLHCLRKVLELVGSLEEGDGRVLVFGGDFVDRGEHSLEVYCTLLLLKLSHPSNVILLRGNHEDTMICSVYGFCDEIAMKYGAKDARHILKFLGPTFSALPICARTESAFIVHGGLPSSDFSLSQVEAISSETRCGIATVVEPRNEQEKIIENMLWSDPSHYDGVAPNGRGCGIEFGPDVARDFLDRHDLKYIVRGHEPAELGMQVLDCGDDKAVVTVFSTASYPNGEGDNLGAVVTLDETRGGLNSTCSPLDFTYSARQQEETNEGGDALGGNSLEILKAMIYNKRRDLEQKFITFANRRNGGRNKENDDNDDSSHVTITQWVDILSNTLDLQDVPWHAIQPSMAPVVSDETSLINWREFLHKLLSSSNLNQSLEEGQVELLSDNHDKLVQIFSFLDTDGSGALDLGEFVNGVKILNSKHLPGDSQIKDPEKLFYALDLDGNGEIDIDEFSQGIAKSAALANLAESLDDTQVSRLHENKEMLLMAFKYLDRDGSGSIDLDEFRVGVDLVNKRLPEGSRLPDAEELFKALDLDGSGEIDLEEFNQIFSL